MQIMLSCVEQYGPIPHKILLCWGEAVGDQNPSMHLTNQRNSVGHHLIPTGVAPGIFSGLFPCFERLITCEDEKTSLVGKKDHNFEFNNKLSLREAKPVFPFTIMLRTLRELGIYTSQVKINEYCICKTITPEFFSCRGIFHVPYRKRNYFKDPACEACSLEPLSP